MNVDKANQGFDPEKTLDAVWCVDSETSERVLMDRRTNKQILRLPRNSKSLEDNRPSIQEGNDESL